MSTTTIHDAVRVTYGGNSGKFTASYGPFGMSDTVVGRGSENGYGVADRGHAAYLAAKRAVEDYARKSGNAKPDWTRSGHVVGAIHTTRGRVSYVVTFTETSA